MPKSLCEDATHWEALTLHTIPTAKAIQSSSSWNTLGLLRWNHKSWPAEGKRSQAGQVAKPELSPTSAPCHCRQRQTQQQACSLPFLIPVPLGHPLVEKPGICRNAEGAVNTETEGPNPKKDGYESPGSFKMTCKLWSARICGAET